MKNEFDELDNVISFHAYRFEKLKRGEVIEDLYEQLKRKNNPKKRLSKEVEAERKKHNENVMKAYRVK